MIPETSTTAILLAESLSSTICSSNCGPALDLMCETFIGINPPSNWVKLPNKLNASSASKTSETIIHPRLLRGRAGIGDIISGGGELYGGGASGGISLLSIV